MDKLNFEEFMELVAFMGVHFFSRTSNRQMAGSSFYEKVELMLRLFL